MLTQNPMCDRGAPPLGVTLRFRDLQLLGKCAAAAVSVDVDEGVAYFVPNVLIQPRCDKYKSKDGRFLRRGG